MSEPIPVLTLWQPWASLVALGVKTIETRSWSTKYRGPLAIHAAGRNPCRYREDTWVDRWKAHRRMGDGGFDLSEYETREPQPDRMWRGLLSIVDLPLGAIIGTATLADVVPICAIEDEELPPCIAVGPTDLTLWEVPDYWHNQSDEVDITDQRPYGDFTPGRFAWLLADVEALPEPVAFKGGQRLAKKWTPR